MNEISVSNMSNITTRQESQTSSAQVSNPEKKKRLEALSYLKAHLDIIAVGLTIAFLTYSIIQLKRKTKS